LNGNPKGFSDKKLQELDDALHGHAGENRAEILASDACFCVVCYSRFPPSAITRWQDEVSAICPNPDCCSRFAVIGSASGVDFDDYACSATDNAGGET
jgi:hypothetical protein